MDATPSHRALLRHADVMRASMAARSRAISANWLLAMLMVGLAVAVWAGHLFAFSFVQQLPFPVMFAIGTYLPTIVPALFAFVVVVLVGSIQNWAVRRAYLSNFKRLDIPAEIDALFEIEAEGLRVSTERITIFPKWGAVDSVEHHALGWVLSADQLTFLIPRDSFADEAAERAFLAALVGRLTDETRERSHRAVTFAEGSVAAQ